MKYFFIIFLKLPIWFLALFSEAKSFQYNPIIDVDTFWFHCLSASVKPSCRVEIYATLRRNPFLPWPGLHLFSIPYSGGRSGDFSNVFFAWLEKVGLRKMPWIPVGFGRIKDAVRMA